MTMSDEEDENLALFLESEVLSEVSDQEEGKAEQPKAKKLRGQNGNDSEVEQHQADGSSGCLGATASNTENKNHDSNCKVSATTGRIETGIFSKIPPELFPHILKFLSSEDLIACALVCRFLSYAASDESLWRRLYCMRWGLLPPSKKLRECPWKNSIFSVTQRTWWSLLGIAHLSSKSTTSKCKQQREVKHLCLHR